MRHRMGIYLIKGAVAEQAAAALERESARARARESESPVQPAARQGTLPPASGNTVVWESLDKVQGFWTR